MIKIKPKIKPKVRIQRPQNEHQGTREGTEYSDWMQLCEKVFTPVPISPFLCEREPKNEFTGTLKHRQRDQEAQSQKNISFLSLNQSHAVTVATLLGIPDGSSDPPRPDEINYKCNKLFKIKSVVLSAFGLWLLTNRRVSWGPLSHLKACYVLQSPSKIIQLFN